MCYMYYTYNIILTYCAVLYKTLFDNPYMQFVKFLLSIACVQSYKTFNNCKVDNLPLINPN